MRNIIVRSVQVPNVSVIHEVLHKMEVCILTLLHGSKMEFKLGNPYQKLSNHSTTADSLIINKIIEQHIMTMSVVT